MASSPCTIVATHPKCSGIHHISVMPLTVLTGTEFLGSGQVWQVEEVSIHFIYSTKVWIYFFFPESSRMKASLFRFSFLVLGSWDCSAVPTSIEWKDRVDGSSLHQWEHSGFKQTEQDQSRHNITNISSPLCFCSCFHISFTQPQPFNLTSLRMHDMMQWRSTSSVNLGIRNEMGPPLAHAHLPFPPAL